MQEDASWDSLDELGEEEVCRQIGTLTGLEASKVSMEVIVEPFFQGAPPSEVSFLLVILFMWVHQSSPFSIFPLPCRNLRISPPFSQSPRFRARSGPGATGMPPLGMPKFREPMGGSEPPSALLILVDVPLPPRKRRALQWVP